MFVKTTNGKLAMLRVRSILCSTSFRNVWMSSPKGEDFYVICHGGGRSNRAAEYMRENGYQANNIAGGTTAWFEANLPWIVKTGRIPLSFTNDAIS